MQYDLVDDNNQITHMSMKEEEKECLHCSLHGELDLGKRSYVPAGSPQTPYSIVSPQPAIRINLHLPLDSSLFYRSKMAVLLPFNNLATWSLGPGIQNSPLHAKIPSAAPAALMVTSDPQHTLWVGAPLTH